MPLPGAILQFCGGYTGANSLLDLVVGGCVVFGTYPAIQATQPDTIDAAAPAAGAGAPYTLSASSSASAKVDTCTDHSGAKVDLATCLAQAAYSSYFKLSAGRVILK